MTEEPKTSVKTYRGEHFNVLWDGSLCQHCGDCLRGLPEVFDLSKRPWVAVDAAPEDKVVAQVEACPFKALTIQR